MTKSILKSDFVKMVTALATVGILSGVSLVFVYNYSMPKIKANVNAATEQGIRSIFPDAHTIDKTKLDGVFQAKDAEGKLVGYAFTAEGNGYQGTIKMIAGITPDLSKMTGMEVLESQETPGLGAEIAEKPFREQFDGLDAAGAIEYVKNQKPEKPNQIEAVTGATISSRAVVNILNKRIEDIRKEI
jgi:Na+-translocating ferredoxin:NAD+ oxidoreductase subunit G